MVLNIAYCEILKDSRIQNNFLKEIENLSQGTGRVKKW